MKKITILIFFEYLYNKWMCRYLSGIDDIESRLLEDP